MKLRHDERVKESTFEEKVPHYERQFQEFISLKSAHSTTNKDRRVVLVRPATSNLEADSIQT